MINLAQPEGDQTEADIQYTKEGLTINGEVYSKLLQVPTPKQLVNLKPEELRMLSKIAVKKGKELTVNKSVFIPYVVEAENIQRVKDVYTKLKIQQPGARHIVCAYSIPHSKPFLANDYQDDGEPGAGRIMSELLVNNNIQNVAVFVVRKYGGVRMGSDRFLCYEEVAKQAVEALTGKQLITRAKQNELNQQERASKRKLQQREPDVRGRQQSRGHYRGSYQHKASHPPRGNASVRGAKPSYARIASQGKSIPQRGFYAQSMYNHRGHTYDYRNGRVLNNSYRGRGYFQESSHRGRKHWYGRMNQQSQPSSVEGSEMDYEFSEPEQPNLMERWSSDHEGAWSEDNTLVKDVE